ncbi:hypothetical protein AAE02nite_00500 [Adhaeribacter aerolatus]|uniref:SHOCT domain-containing protein n=1 Tax=Adhaeribacter aerolatus TaxID=670289 RepID=A0A512ARR6_9BACT|nr:SHOCT domain-containing protein [Adhaeribacter aerolatus]GEO02386.1 hypothetical protein AAE02nite_00500 [Adhaeribacter aerolatus]
MENDFSALKSIQELKNLLDSGAITQQEYEVLKRKIIFGNNSSAATNPPQPTPVNPLRTETPPPIVPPTPMQERVYPRAVEGNSINSEYKNSEFKNVTNANREETVVNSIPENANRNFRSLTLDEPEEVTEGKRKDWLLTILISLAVILLVGLVAYHFFSDSESERLTSKSGPGTEEAAASEVTGTESPATKPEPAVTDSVRLNPEKGPTPPVNTPVEATTTEAATTAAGTLTVPAAETAPAATETIVPTPASPPKLSEEEALNKIKDRLQAYYADMKSAPFAAQNHFAPTVERYYTLTGTTPQAINENISSYHFNEFQDSQSSIEEGTLKMTSSGENGYEVTYIEHGTAFRKSKGQKQETTARVRARFNKDFKMTYFRQEQLLENRFIEE